MAGSAFSIINNNPNSGVDAILAEFKNLSLVWTQNMRPFENSIYFTLATLYFVFGLHKAIFKRSDGLEILIFVALGVIRIMFFHTLMIEGPIWLGKLIEDFQFIGSWITGVDALSPGALLHQGIGVAVAILNYDFDKGLIEGIPVAILSAMAAFGVLLSFLAMSAYMLLLLAISSLILGPGSIVLVFTASSWTIGMLRGYLDYVLNVAVKLFVLYLVVALARDYGSKIAQGFNGLPTSNALENILYVAGVSGLLAVLTIMLPNVASSITSGAVSFRNQDFINSMQNFYRAGTSTAQALLTSSKMSRAGLAHGSKAVYQASHSASMVASNVLRDIRTKAFNTNKKKISGIKKLSK